MICSSPRRFSSNPFSSAIDPSRLNTAYRFFSKRPSSVLAGSTIARYGPSSSKKMLFSDRVLNTCFTGSTSIWYLLLTRTPHTHWWFVYSLCTW